MAATAQATATDIQHVLGLLDDVVGRLARHTDEIGRKLEPLFNPADSDPFPEDVPQRPLCPLADLIRTYVNTLDHVDTHLSAHICRIQL
jgi:hypothetical protein